MLVKIIIVYISEGSGVVGVGNENTTSETGGDHIRLRLCVVLRIQKEGCRRLVVVSNPCAFRFPQHNPVHVLQQIYPMPSWGVEGKRNWAVP